jgi:hypothetical protein
MTWRGARQAAWVAEVMSYRLKVVVFSDSNID